MSDPCNSALSQEDAADDSRAEILKEHRRTSCRGVLHRFVKFSIVGAGGVIVQVVTLGVLLRAAGVHYLLATALAVEASVLNNSDCSQPGSMPNQKFRLGDGFIGSLG